jgi:glucosamine--fructose-6-phosphate aminotransferase (isomerizing)
MCGLFGFITKTGARPDLDRLRAIALETEQRGAHAFGLVWIDRDGRLHAFKRPGPISAYLHELDRCRHARVIVGHCRYATHGHPAINANNHPHRVGRGWLVHNGVVRNYLQIVQRYGLETTTDCDSEVLGLLMAKIPGSLERRATIGVAAAEGPLAIMGLWAKPARLLLVRRGNQLWIGETRRGAYLGSLPGELPAQPEPIPDGIAIVRRLNDRTTGRFVKFRKHRGHEESPVFD